VPGASVIPPGGGEVIGDASHRRVEVVCEHDALHATWVRLAAGGEGADLHVHRRHTDLFYVLAGELTLRLGPAGEPVAAPAGTLARIPPLVVHGYRNAGDAEVRFLNLHAPGSGFAAYLRALRDGRGHTFDQEPPPPDGGRPPEEASVAPLDAVVGAGLQMTVLTAAPGPAPALERVPGLVAAYVLQGALDVALGDGRARAEAGAWVTIPPGVAHAFAASAPARYLRVRAPAQIAVATGR
jgi:quercetin dioxygenase-like cupin family protein